MDANEREASVPAAVSAPTPPAPDEGELVIEEERFVPRCLALIHRIRRTGEEVVITRRGKPVARLQPIPGSNGDGNGDDGEEDAPVWDMEAIP